jgi:hypothetical protein
VKNYKKTDGDGQEPVLFTVDKKEIALNIMLRFMHCIQIKNLIAASCLSSMVPFAHLTTMAQWLKATQSRHT